MSRTFPVGRLRKMEENVQSRTTNTQIERKKGRKKQTNKQKSKKKNKNKNKGIIRRAKKPNLGDNKKPQIALV